MMARLTETQASNPRTGASLQASSALEVPFAVMFSITVARGSLRYPGRSSSPVETDSLYSVDRQGQLLRINCFIGKESRALLDEAYQVFIDDSASNDDVIAFYYRNALQAIDDQLQRDTEVIVYSLRSVPGELLAILTGYDVTYAVGKNNSLFVNGVFSINPLADYGQILFKHLVADYGVCYIIFLMLPALSLLNHQLSPALISDFGFLRATNPNMPFFTAYIRSVADSSASPITNADNLAPLFFPLSWQMRTKRMLFILRNQKDAAYLLNIFKRFFPLDRIYLTIVTHPKMISRKDRQTLPSSLEIVYTDGDPGLFRYIFFPSFKDRRFVLAVSQDELDRDSPAVKLGNLLGIPTVKADFYFRTSDIVLLERDVLDIPAIC